MKLAGRDELVPVTRAAARSLLYAPVVGQFRESRREPVLFGDAFTLRHVCRAGFCRPRHAVGLYPPGGTLAVRPRPETWSRVASMMTQGFAPRPTVCASAACAAGPWRGPAAPRSCQVSSAIWPRAEAPSGSPLERRPPEGLTGSRDAISPPPSRTQRPPPPSA